MAEPAPAIRNPKLVLAIGIPVIVLTWFFFRWMRGDPYIVKAPVAEKVEQHE